MSDNELVVIKPGALELPPRKLYRQIAREYEERRHFAVSLLTEGIEEDFARLPNTQKQTLLQPGADKIIAAAMLRQDQHILPESIHDHQNSYYHIIVRVDLLNRSGEIVGSGIGSCSSREVKYAYRWMEKKDIENHPDLKDYDLSDFVKRTTQWGTKYRVPNPDIDDLTNTWVQMASVRAKRKAVQSTFGLSGKFTVNLREEEEYAQDPPPKKKTQPKAAFPKGNGAPANESLNFVDFVEAECEKEGFSPAESQKAKADLCRSFEIESLDEIPEDKIPLAKKHFNTFSKKAAKR
jgi:hypothetical protein